MLQHVTITTPDLQASIDFYAKYIGLEVIRDLREMGRPIVFMAEKADETQVELIEDPEHAFDGSGISIGFKKADVDAVREAFEAAGLHPTPMVSPNPHVKFFFVKDPAGVSVQII